MAVPAGGPPSVMHNNSFDSYDSQETSFSSYLPAGMAIPRDGVQGTGAALSRRQWKSADTASSCRVCGKDFKMFTKKHHCRHCGEVVCGDCSKGRARLETFNKAKKALRICTSCGEKFEADRSHPLYTLLGEKLGSIYFYEFTKNGDDDLDILCESTRNPSLFEELLNRNRVQKDHRRSLLEKLRAAYSSDSDDTGLQDSQHRHPATPHGGDGGDDPSAFDPTSPPGIPRGVGAGGGDGSPTAGQGGAQVHHLHSHGSEGPDGKMALRHSTGNMTGWKKLCMNKAASVIKKGATMQSMAQLLEEKAQMQRQLDAQSVELARMHDAEMRLRQMEADKMKEEKAAKAMKLREERAKVDMTRKVKRRRRAFERNMHHKEACELCDRSYTGWGGAEHHCRVCFRSCCKVCSSGRVSEGRACDWCFAETVILSKDLTSSMSGDHRQKDYWLHVVGTVMSSLQSMHISPNDSDIPPPAPSTIASTGFMSPGSIMASPQASDSDPDTPRGSTRGSVLGYSTTRLPQGL
eukprot:TRINITY_DN16992_c1_g1_i1.p1 TRINITY_DN16992_c1_g1~~TRINITY_DN16992_c1_g1_i1.p1  ORF type:complete len:521 (+),score=149.29 TRINITY_DN16992_c1_g1_i1:116-1678(+)